jgi:hypothetical protein
MLERGTGRRRSARHYHVIEQSVGNPLSHQDNLFLSRRRATQAAKERAEWLAYLGGCRLETLLGPPGRYLVTTGPHDAGRMIVVEDCDDEECVGQAIDSTLKSWKE